MSSIPGMAQDAPFRVYTTYAAKDKPGVTLQFNVKVAQAAYGWLINSATWLVKFVYHEESQGTQSVVCSLSTPEAATTSYLGRAVRVRSRAGTRAAITTSLLPGLWWTPEQEEYPVLDDRMGSGGRRTLVFTVPASMYERQDVGMQRVRPIMRRPKLCVPTEQALVRPEPAQVTDAAVQEAVQCINKAVRLPDSPYTLGLNEHEDAPATLVVYRRYT